MMNNALFLSLLSGIFFGLWPLVMRLSGLAPAWATMSVAFGVFVAGVLLLKGASLPALNGLLLVGLFAGLLNGLGTIVFTKMLSMQSAELSRYIPIAIVLMLVIAVVGGYFLYGEPFTVRKVVGIAAALIAAILLV